MLNFILRTHSSTDRACGFGPQGSRFESWWVHQDKTFRLFESHIVGGAKCRPLILWGDFNAARRALPRLAVGQNEVRAEQSSASNLFRKKVALLCDFRQRFCLFYLSILTLVRANHSALEEWRWPEKTEKTFRGQITNHGRRRGRRIPSLVNNAIHNFGVAAHSRIFMIEAR